MFRGNPHMSAFKLVEYYRLAHIALSSAVLCNELLQAHVHCHPMEHWSDSDAWKRRGTYWSTYCCRERGSGYTITLGKQNGPVRLVEANVIEADEQVVCSQTSAKGPPMTVPYEHMRITMSSVLTMQQLECSFGDEFGKSLWQNMIHTPTP